MRSNVKVGRGCIARNVTVAAPAATTVAAPAAKPQPSTDWRLATKAQTAAYRAEMIRKGHITPVAA